MNVNLLVLCAGPVQPWWNQIPFLEQWFPAFPVEHLPHKRRTLNYLGEPSSDMSAAAAASREKTFWLLRGILVPMKVFLWRLQHMAGNLIYVSCTRNKDEREEKARKLSQVSHHSLSISRPSSVWHTQHVGVRTSSTRTYKRKGGGIKTIGSHLSECKCSLESKYTIQD